MQGKSFKDSFPSCNRDLVRQKRILIAEGSTVTLVFIGKSSNLHMHTWTLVEHVFGFWEDTDVPGENPHLQEENMQVPHGKDPAGNQTRARLLWGEALTTVQPLLQREKVFVFFVSFGFLTAHPARCVAGEADPVQHNEVFALSDPRVSDLKWQVIENRGSICFLTLCLFSVLVLLDVEHSLHQLLISVSTDILSHVCNVRLAEPKTKKNLKHFDTFDPQQQRDNMNNMSFS